MATPVNLRDIHVFWRSPVHRKRYGSGAPEAIRFPLKNFMIFAKGITTVCYVSSSPQLVKRTLQENRYYLSPIKNKELKIIPTSLRFDFRRIRPHNETFFILFVAVFQDSMLGIRHGRRPNFLRRLWKFCHIPGRVGIDGAWRYVLFVGKWLRVTVLYFLFVIFVRTH
jgi:hypothetical protein